MMRRKKACVRGFVGDEKICSGGPSSAKTPASRKHTLRGDFPREAHLVGSEQHGHALLGELAHDVEHVGHELRVERRGDLVEQQ